NSRGAFYANGGAQPATAYDGYGGDNTNTFSNNDYFNSGAMCSNCTATASGNITSDPMFMDAANHDYRLKSGSPAAGYGLWDGIDPYFNGGTTPPPAAKPTIPTGLKATVGNAQVTLSWNPNPAGDNVDTYQVYWTTDSTWAAASQQALSVSGTSYTVTNLTNSTPYYFRISAHNSVDYGDWSTTAVTATPSAPVSLVPGDLDGDSHVSVTDLSILLSYYGTNNSVADIDKSGRVDVTDLSTLLSHFGT
ncbi:fibronectin type III domain-containing protein, partial [Candidatus Saccharibacteria bacterium]|nr:fibronectin type III domain-containing protein [Candidatus Saccharibacteria bacterium]